MTGEGIMGCNNVTNKRITCCCDEDFCNGINYQGYADLGYAENWNPQPTEARSNKPESQPTEGIQSGHDIVNELNEINDNNPDQLSMEKCVITDAIGTDCSCGGECSSVEYEYKAITDKCPDQELTTGEFGEETCNPDNPIYQIGQKVQCLVTDCLNGVFRITSDGYMRNVIYIHLVPIFCFLFYG